MVSRHLSIGLLIILSLGLFSCQAQSSLKQGVATYVIDVDDPKGDNFLMAMAMTGNEVIVSFNKEFISYETDLGLIAVSCVLDKKQETGLLLMNVMGDKIASVLEGESYKRASTAAFAYNITETEETRDINGFFCKRAIIAVGEKNYDYWYCEDSDLSHLPSPFTFKELKGIPVSYGLNLNNMDITLTLGSLLDRCEKEFSLSIPAGYKEVSPDELLGALTKAGGL